MIQNHIRSIDLITCYIYILIFNFPPMKTFFCAISLISIWTNSYSCYVRTSEVPKEVITLVDSICTQLTKNHNVNLIVESISDSDDLGYTASGWYYASLTYEIAGLNQVLNLIIENYFDVSVRKDELLMLSLSKTLKRAPAIDEQILMNNILRKIKFFKKIKIKRDNLVDSRFIVKYYDRRLKQHFNSNFAIGLFNIDPYETLKLIRPYTSGYNDLIGWNTKFTTRERQLHKIAYALITDEPPPNQMIISHFYLFDILTFELRAMYSTCVYNSRDVISR